MGFDSARARERVGGDREDYGSGMRPLDGTGLAEGGTGTGLESEGGCQRGDRRWIGHRRLVEMVACFMGIHFVCFTAEKHLAASGDLPIGKTFGPGAGHDRH